MCEIVVRTSRGEYTGGETVFGAVYVKIAGPSAACGVRLKFTGYESYLYSHGSSPGSIRRASMLQDSHQYIKCDSIILHEAEDPLALGEYVLPFQKRLPHDLPGSFTKRSADTPGPRWEVIVVYKVQAELIGSEEITEWQPIHIHQRVPDQNICTEAASTAQVKKIIGYTPLTARVQIDEKVYYTGDTPQVGVNFETAGGFTPDFNINAINFKLQREFVIVLRKSREPSRAPLFSHLQYPGFSQISANLETPEGSDQPTFIEPEGHMNVIRTVDFVSRGKIKLAKGVRSVFVPLSHPDNTPLSCPTTTGVHIFWLQWKPAAWVHNCQLLVSDLHECAVPQEVLVSHTFSSLPCFHVP